MVAEIGGYAGLMIGFSILDFVVACQIAVSFGALSREKYWDKKEKKRKQRLCKPYCKYHNDMTYSVQFYKCIVPIPPLNEMQWLIK